MADIVSIADVRDTQILERAESLEQREVIRQRLAGVIKVTERVDDWNRGMLRQLFDGLVRIRAGDDGVGPALEVARVVADRLAGADAIGAVIEIDRAAAELRHARLETDERAQRVLFKQQHNDLAFERVQEMLRRGLDCRGGVEQPFDLTTRGIRQREQILVSQWFK